MIAAVSVVVVTVAVVSIVVTVSVPVVSVVIVMVVLMLSPSRGREQDNADCARESDADFPHSYLHRVIHCVVLCCCVNSLASGLHTMSRRLFVKHQKQFRDDAPTTRKNV